MPPDPAETITSTANPRLKGLVRLRERRERDRSGLFLIEGYRELRRALEGAVDLAEVWCCPALYLGANEDALVASARAGGAEVVTVAEAPFRKASYRDRPEGLLAVARQFPTGLDRLDPGPNPLLLVVEGIEKPGNLGTMMRTAEAAGAGSARRLRPDHRSLQPQRGAGLPGHPVLPAPGGSRHARGPGLAALPGHQERGHHPGGDPSPLGGRPHRGRGRGGGQRAVRPLRRLAGGRERAGAHPDAGHGGQPQRRHGGRDRAVRGGPPATPQGRAGPAAVRPTPPRR